MVCKFRSWGFLIVPSGFQHSPGLRRRDLKTARGGTGPQRWRRLARTSAQLVQTGRDLILFKELDVCQDRVCATPAGLAPWEDGWAPRGLGLPLALYVIPSHGGCRGRVGSQLLSLEPCAPALWRTC